MPDIAEQEARVYLGPEGPSDPVVLHNWIELMARQSATRSRSCDEKWIFPNNTKPRSFSSRYVR